MYDMTWEAAYLPKTDEDKAAWWYLYLIYGPEAALEMAQRWGI